MSSYNVEPMLQAVHTPIRSRSPSLGSDDDQSDSATLYTPSPSPRLRPRRARLMNQTSQTTLFSRSPTPVLGSTSSPTSSSFSSSSSAVKVKVEKDHTGSKKTKKRSSGGARKGEPRRCQNMIAQKKYRDKKVQALALVSHYYAVPRAMESELAIRCLTLWSISGRHSITHHSKSAWRPYNQ